jgi:PhnB protein
MPYLRVADAASAIKFYKKVFGATEAFRLKMGGKIGHAELNIGGAVVMLSDEFPDIAAIGPKALKGTSVLLAVYVVDVDRTVARALKAGAVLRQPVADRFYGDRTGQIEDPFGHVWSIQTRIARVTPKDMQKRLDQLITDEATAEMERRTAKGAGTAGQSRRKTSVAKARGVVGRKAVPVKVPVKKLDAPVKSSVARTRTSAVPAQANKAAPKKSPRGRKGKAI